MDVLGKLFGSMARVKLMKLFLFNRDEQMVRSDIMKRAKVSSSETTRELGQLERAGMIKRVSFFQEGKPTRSGKPGKKRRVQGYVLNHSFRYMLPLQALLVHSVPMQDKEIVSRLARVGKVKAVIVSGLFVQDADSRLDMLVIGEGISQARLKNVIAAMEAEIGKELRYAAFETGDFKYRMSVYDRLVRDVFDYPHQVVVDRIGLE
ncbi:MAG: hypothetical protein RL150_69 [Candidatus Parcubacteria bacterium]|jgi:hypothetical protein